MAAPTPRPSVHASRAVTGSSNSNATFNVPLLGAPHASRTGTNALPQAPQNPEGTTDPSLCGGIDPGDPLTAKGRIKKRTRDREFFDPDDPDRYRYRSYHIRRAFDLYGHLPTIINDGIKRRAKEASGEMASEIQSDREYESFNLILNHLEGLSDDIVRLKRSPKAFHTLTRKIREAADQARNNDTANLKKDIACMLTPDGSSVLTVVVKGKKASSKHDRGFDNDIMGRYLCPISLDWDDPFVREDIKEGKKAILACDWPRLLYANCECDLEDLESGLGRNMALVRVVKYLFTGRSAAFSESAGGKTTRSGNAALAGMKDITPRVVAYAACMLRYAISNEETWSSMDKEFNMQEFYWHVVSIFDDSGDFGKELLAWWNIKIFGTSTATTLGSDTPAAPVALLLLRIQRQAKRAADPILCDITNNTDIDRIRAHSVESGDCEGGQPCSPIQPLVPPEQVESDRCSSVSPGPIRPSSPQLDRQASESRNSSPRPPSPRYHPPPSQNAVTYQRQPVYHPTAMYYPHLPPPGAPASGAFHPQPYIAGGPPLRPWY